MSEETKKLTDNYQEYKCTCKFAIAGKKIAEDIFNLPKCGPNCELYRTGYGNKNPHGIAMIILVLADELKAIIEESKKNGEEKNGQ